MGAVASINKCYNDVCCPKDIKPKEEDNQREGREVSSFQNINSLVSNPSIDNDIYDNQNRNIFLFENDEFNSINVEPQNYGNENNNIDNNKIYGNKNINKDNGMINENNNDININIKDSPKSNSSNFSFKCFMKNDQINNELNNDFQIDHKAKTNKVKNKNSCNKVEDDMGNIKNNIMEKNMSAWIQKK